MTVREEVLHQPQAILVAACLQKDIQEAVPASQEARLPEEDTAEDHLLEEDIAEVHQEATDDKNT